MDHPAVSVYVHKQSAVACGLCLYFGDRLLAVTVLSRGYLTLGTGKLYHPAHPNNGDGNLSWSQLPQQFSCTKSHDGNAGPPNTYCQPNAPACSDKGTPTAPNPRWCAVDLPLNGSAGPGEPSPKFAVACDL